jgi:hypothetical protein
MVFDDHDNGLPAAFRILKRQEIEDIKQFLTVVTEPAQQRCLG